MNSARAATVGARVLTALVLLSLAQAGGLVMWTDANGVVHVDEPRNAPSNAKQMSGDGYSRIDDDARALVLPDGGTRDADSAWWRGRFTVARNELAAAQRREREAEQIIREATREVCATATAEAMTNVDVWSPRGGTVVGHRAGVTVLSPGQGARFSDRSSSTTRKCERGTASPTQRADAFRATEARREAERVVRELEREARSASVPLRHWR